MFRIKLCGLKTPLDAAAAAAAGADAVGLNFYPRSSRYIDDASAAQIVAALPESVCKVGLFVNESPQQIRARYEQLGLDLIQLHGDESPAEVAQLHGLPVLKAFRLAPGAVDTVVTFVTVCADAGHPLAGVLVDAYDASQYGGTGMKADWDGATLLKQRLPDVPMVLAGGLTPENVEAAIAAVHPSGVDTASGVEVARGQKDPQRMQAFVSAARAAFARGA